VEPNLCLVESNVCLVKSNLCLVESNVCLVESNLCLVESNLCLAESNLCFVESNLCLVEPNHCLVEANLCLAESADIPVLPVLVSSCRLLAVLQCVPAPLPLRRLFRTRPVHGLGEPRDRRAEALAVRVGQSVELARQRAPALSPFSSARHCNAATT
jgi:hypothetical protein